MHECAPLLPEGLQPLSSAHWLQVAEQVIDEADLHRLARLHFLRLLCGGLCLLLGGDLVLFRLADVLTALRATKYEMPKYKMNCTFSNAMMKLAQVLKNSSEGVFGSSAKYASSS